MQFFLKIALFKKLPKLIKFSHIKFILTFFCRIMYVACLKRMTRIFYTPSCIIESNIMNKNNPGLVLTRNFSKPSEHKKIPSRGAVLPFVLTRGLRCA